jgi:hypothetical protein
MSDLYIPRGDMRRQVVKSVWFNLDNGSGTTIDDVLLYVSQPISIKSARIVYVDATAGTVAAGTAQVGTTVGGAELVAATNYENAKTVGAVTAMTLKAAATSMAANTMISVRHTGVASTAAGQAYVEIEFIVLG